MMIGSQIKAMITYKSKLMMTISILEMTGTPIKTMISCENRLIMAILGSAVVECLTRDRRAAGSSLTGVTAL